MSLMTIISAFLGAEINASLRHHLRLLAVYGVAVVCALAALGFGLGALHSFIAETRGPLAADLIIGGGLLVLALILIGIAQYMSYRAKRRAALVKALAAAPVAAGVLLKKPKVGLAALAIAIALGAVAGRKVSK